MIDKLDEQLPALTSFILPGGSEVSSRLHLCRTYTRKLERKLSNFDKNIEAAPEFYIKYLNRLSDFFFVAARYVNFLDKIEETEVALRSLKLIVLYWNYYGKPCNNYSESS